MPDSGVARSMYQTDYRTWPLKPRVTVPPRPPNQPIVRSPYRPPQVDLEILRQFKTGVNVPFNLLHREKEVVQIDPHAPIPNIKLEDKIFESKLRARRERPTIYMIPQISLDDVPEDIMYGKTGKTGLVTSIYSSDWKKACQLNIDNSPLKSKDEAEKTFTKADLLDKSIDTTRPRAPDVVEAMDPGLHKYIRDWAKQDPIEFVDTTEIFWKNNRNRGLCSLCDPQPEAVGLTAEQNEELERCLKNNNLRTPYTVHPAGYTGYVPVLPVGIPFPKKRVTRYAQFVTTSMVNQGLVE